MTTATHNGIVPMSNAAYDMLAALSAGCDEARQPVKRRATYWLKFGMAIVATIRMEVDTSDAAIREAVATQIELCGSTFCPKDWTVSRAVSAVRNACRIERECDPA